MAALGWKFGYLTFKSKVHAALPDPRCAGKLTDEGNTHLSVELSMHRERHNVQWEDHCMRGGTTTLKKGGAPQHSTGAPQEGGAPQRSTGAPQHSRRGEHHSTSLLGLHDKSHIWGPPQFCGAASLRQAFISQAAPSVSELAFGARGARQ